MNEIKALMWFLPAKHEELDRVVIVNIVLWVSKIYYMSSYIYNRNITSQYTETGCVYDKNPLITINIVK